MKFIKKLFNREDMKGIKKELELNKDLDQESLDAVKELFHNLYFSFVVSFNTNYLC